MTKVLCKGQQDEENLAEKRKSKPIKWRKMRKRKPRCSVPQNTEESDSSGEAVEEGNYP